MRLSAEAILNVLTVKQAQFLAKPITDLTYSYLSYEHKIINYLLSGNVPAAEHVLLYDPSFGSGISGAIQLPKNKAIYQLLQSAYQKKESLVQA